MNIKLPPIIHIVRRFGRVGGMESYVWNLVHELIKQDLHVEVICEETFGEFDSKIVIHKISRSHPRPRWKSMRRFRRLVTQYVSDNFKGRYVLIHSHERSNCHHVTTFHGPPINSPKTFLRRLLTSRRVSAWEQMEKDELLYASATQILAVSTIVKNQLLDLYPELSSKQINIAHPGIDPQPIGRREYNQNPEMPKKFVFVGKEWKRKGLDLAIEILEGLQKQWTLDVFGPSREDLPLRFVAHPLINIEGWRQTIPWEEYEVLIHPARQEPFGMVVAEARYHGVKVLTSSVVGSVELGFRDLAVLDLKSPIREWVKALERLTADGDKRVSDCLWTWSDLASLHKSRFYPIASRDLMKVSER